MAEQQRDGLADFFNGPSTGGGSRTFDPLHPLHMQRFRRKSFPLDRISYDAAAVTLLSLKR